MADSVSDFYRFVLCERDTEFQPVCVSRRLAFGSARSPEYMQRFALLCEALVGYLSLKVSLNPDTVVPSSASTSQRWMGFVGAPSLPGLLTHPDRELISSLVVGTISAAPGAPAQ